MNSPTPSPNRRVHVPSQPYINPNLPSLALEVFFEGNCEAQTEILLTRAQQFELGFTEEELIRERLVKIVEKNQKGFKDILLVNTPEQSQERNRCILKTRHFVQIILVQKHSKSQYDGTKLHLPIKHSSEHNHPLIKIPSNLAVLAESKDQETIRIVIGGEVKHLPFTIGGLNLEINKKANSILGIPTALGALDLTVANRAIVID